MYTKDQNCSICIAFRETIYVTLFYKLFHESFPSPFSIPFQMTEGRIIPPKPFACYQYVYAILQAAKVSSVVNAILPLPLGEEVIIEVDSAAQITDYS